MTFPPRLHRRIAGTNGLPSPASAVAKMHGRYHLIRSTILPGALIGPQRSAPFVHPCRPGAPIHPFRLHSTEDPRPYCLLPSSSSSSTVNPVSRSHQASIDSTTSLTCPTTIFISFQTNLISPFLPSSSPSHTSSHHLAFCNQFDHPLCTHQPFQETHISCQLQSLGFGAPVLRSSVLQSTSASYPQEFQPNIDTCPLAFQSLASAVEP